MSETVRVPYGDDAGETATLLLAAAEDKDLGPEVVRTDTSTTGHFVVPKEVADAAGVEVEKDEDESKSIDDMTKAELQAEIDSRNAGRDDADQIKPDGANKGDLLAALKADEKE